MKYPVITDAERLRRARIKKIVDEASGGITCEGMDYESLIIGLSNFVETEIKRATLKQKYKGGLKWK